MVGGPLSSARSARFDELNEVQSLHLLDPAPDGCGNWQGEDFGDVATEAFGVDREVVLHRVHDDPEALP